MPSRADSSATAGLPANAAPAYATLFTSLQRLLDALRLHPACADIIAATPPGRAPPPPLRNKVWFMWDFCKKSLDQLQQLDPTLPGAQRSQFGEVAGRSLFCRMLICDSPERLSMMTGEKPGQELDFGDNIRELARAVSSSVGEN